MTGSLFNIASGRCTDGVWLTVRETEECLWVVLDFEGLGSFERSEQEDVLLSLFNAAISNATFLKIENCFDKQTASTFSRFQNGVSSIPESSTFFTGALVFVIKDVNEAEVPGVQQEFEKKICTISEDNGEDNFFVRLYDPEALHVLPFPVDSHAFIPTHTHGLTSRFLYSFHMIQHSMNAFKISLTLLMNVFERIHSFARGATSSPMFACSWPKLHSRTGPMYDVFIAAFLT